MKKNNYNPNGVNVSVSEEEFNAILVENANIVLKLFDYYSKNLKKALSPNEREGVLMSAIWTTFATGYAHGKYDR